MEYNCVRIGDDIIKNEKNDVIHNLGEFMDVFQKITFVMK